MLYRTSAVTLMMIAFALVLNASAGIVVSAGRVVLTLAALGAGAQPFALGVLAATLAIFPMFFSWISGRLSDRFGSRWLLACAAGGTAASMSLAALSSGLPGVFAAAALLGIALSFFNVPLQNLVGMLSGPRERTKNYGNYSLSGSFTGLLGPLLAGLLVDRAGHQAAFLVLAVLALFPAALLIFRGASLPRGKRGATRSGSMSSLLAQPGVRRVLAASSLQHAGQDVFQFYLPAYAVSMGLPAYVIGTLLATTSLAVIVSRLLLTRLITLLDEQRVLAYAFLVGAASFAFVPFCQTAVALGAVAAVFGLAMGCATPITMMLMYSVSAEDRSGEALGLRITVNQVARVAGPILLGAIGSAFGLAPLFWMNGVLFACGGLLGRARSG